MRVLLVSANFYPSVGGVERFTETLACGLVERGHEVTILCCRPPGTPKSDARLGAHVVRIPATYALHRWRRLPYPIPNPIFLISKLSGIVGRVDVVHVQDAVYLTSVLALVAAAWSKTPSVLTQHVGFVPQRSTVLDRLEQLVLLSAGRCTTLATAVVALNPAVAEWAERQWKLSRVRVLPVGVPRPPHRECGKAANRRRFGLSDGDFVALFVGRDVPKKGLDVFFGAADPAYRLIAVTDRQTPVREGVAVLPFMEHDDLQRLMSCVDVFVLPSEAEGFPISIQEALAAGLPVVTTHQPGYEAFLSASDALFVDRDSDAVRGALRRLASDSELRQRLSSHSRNAADRHFDVERFVDAYETLYIDLCRGGNGRRRTRARPPAAVHGRR